MVAAAVTAGCTGGGATPADPTVPTAASTTATTTSTTTVGIATIPAVIDEPYLNRVLAALDEVDGMATRVIVAHKELVPEAAEILNAIYSDHEFTEQVDVWLNTLGRDPQLSGIRSDPGPRQTTVERLIVSSPRCVWLAVRRDYSATAAASTRASTEYVSLRPKGASNDPTHRNPTAWMIHVDGFNEDGSEPENQCAGS